jgi:hypothetical protein
MSGSVTRGGSEWTDSKFLDPRREVEKLRDQLAAHDKPLAFLMGAGTSCAPQGTNGEPLIPAVAGLTALVRERVDELGEKFKTAFNKIDAGIKESLKVEGIHRPVNIEDILSAVRLMLQAMTSAEILRDLSKTEMELVEKTIRSTIAEVACPKEERIPERLPHHSLGRWIHRINRDWPIEIFTTNYDTLIERGLEDEYVPIFDGFVGSRRPFFHSASLVDKNSAPGNAWARLWKIHGSVNWHLEDERFIRGEERTDGELILPSTRKYDESRKQPYVAMLDCLGRFLTQRQDSLLVVLGYSFGDQHVNEVIFESLRVHDRVHVIALLFEDPEEDSSLVEHSRSHRNLILYGPKFGIVGGDRREWKLMDPVDGRTAGLLDVPFDSEFIPDDEPLPLLGRFRLGDFVWFGRFLDQIAGMDYV